MVSATHPPHRLDAPDYAFFKALQKYKKDAQEQNKTLKEFKMQIAKCKMQILDHCQQKI
jgi:hypothetical protein